MGTPLTEKEVNRLFRLLTEEQRKYLENYMNQSKKSKWLQSLAKKKGKVLQKDISLEEAWNKLNDWELLDILDGGYGERPYKCECGMSLRFCYIVHHRLENKMYRLGETCLENYTMLSPELIKDITNGFHKIDLERDDILIKYEQKWMCPDDYQSISLPEQFQKQLEIKLPLSKIQLGRIEQQFKYELNQIRREKEFDRIPHLRKNTFYSSPSSIHQGSANISESITYDQLIQNHIEHLKQIRNHENQIRTSEIKNYWENIQNIIRKSKSGEEIDYSRFLIQMFDILYHLKLY